MYKSQGKQGLFDSEFSQAHLSTMGNPLDAISKVVNFEIFRKTLEESLLNKTKKSKAGANPFDVVLLFKIMILQRYYGLGDKQVEYQIVDRISFKKFLCLSTGDKVPDEKTIWSFRERLTVSGLIDHLFAEFIAYLSSKGLIFNEGQIIDASFTLAPRQRNKKDENEQIKSGEGSSLWSDAPNKQNQKDVNARWTKKGSEVFYGYKNHIKVDSKSKLINTYTVTDASVHDSQALDGLLTSQDKGQSLYADSAYTGKNQEAVIKNKGMENNVCEKRYRNKSLTEEQKSNNKKKSKIRSRVEHVFGFMEQSMHGLRIKSIGIVRSMGIIGLINLTYNIFRYEQIKRLNLFSTN